MFELYYLVLFTEEEGLVGSYPIYVQENAEDYLIENIHNYRNSLRSTREKLFMFNKETEQIDDVTDKFQHLLERKEKDNQITKWLEETHDEMCRLGQIKIENGYFQRAFMHYIDQKSNTLEEYSYEVCDEYVIFSYTTKDYILIGSERYRID
ncbi:hypothetical protein ACL9SP_01720 [Priestia flexa]|uniref:hypothetical protein n=1 Tax=Priestia TaxID=2800373 RepID=UPI002EDA2EDB